MKQHIRFLSGFMIMAVLMSAAEFNGIKGASAEDLVSELRNQQNELDKQQKELNGRLENLKNDINKKKEYRTSILEQMNTLQQQINIESQKIDILKEKIEEKLSIINEVQHDIDEKLDVLGKRLKAIYKAGEVPELAILLGVKSFDDLLDTADMIQKLSKFDSELIKNLKDSISGIQQEKDEIEKNKNEIETSKSLLDEKRKELDNLQQENENIIKDLQSEESSIQAKINANNSKKRSLENRISKSGRKGRQSDSFSTAGYKKGRYMYPVPGYTRTSSKWGDGRKHNGWDFPAPQGTKVVAASDGVVTVANSSNSWGHGWGYHVRVNHGDGYETIYAHLSKVLVSPGQSVKTGQVLGLVGDTGHSHGNHLHFGTAKNGKWYDPKNELN